MELNARPAREPGSVDLRSLARDAIDLTQRIIDRCGPRLAGTEASRKAARLLAARLHPLCDHVAVEPFSVHPDALMGFIRVTTVLYVAGTALLIASMSLAASVCFTAGALVTTSQFLLYREVLDPLFPRRVGHNVVAILEPEDEPSRQLIFAGHHDSTRVFNMLRRLPQLYRLRLAGAFVAVFGMPLVGWLCAAFARQEVPPMIVALDCAMGLVFLGPMWFFLGKEGVPGAGDNLIASSMLVSIARALRSADSGLRGTRVILFSSDAEEAGLRGARAFVRRHEAELGRLPTTLLNIDSVYRADRIQFLCSDLNGFVPLDRALADRCVEIAKGLGVAARTFRMYPGAGATDAAEFARVGVRSTTLIALPTDIEGGGLVYHTPHDTVATIQPTAVEACLGVALGLAREVDENGAQGTRAVPSASTSDARTRTARGQHRTSPPGRTADTPTWR